jgi:hypothetical protein
MLLGNREWDLGDKRGRGEKLGRQTPNIVLRLEKGF